MILFNNGIEMFYLNLEKELFFFLNVLIDEIKISKFI